ncbi:hypothetical protein ElyMa_001913200, partial [Elysia marginata]
AREHYRARVCPVACFSPLSENSRHLLLESGVEFLQDEMKTVAKNRTSAFSVDRVEDFRQAYGSSIWGPILLLALLLNLTKKEDHVSSVVVDTNPYWLS